MLEIAFYYISIALTIIFLLFQSFFKLEILYQPPVEQQQAQIDSIPYQPPSKIDDKKDNEDMEDKGDETSFIMYNANPTGINGFSRRATLEVVEAQV